MYETAIQTLIVPNYSRAYGIGQGWKATENVFLWHAGESDIGYSTITLNYNGAVKTFNTCYDSGDGQSAGSAQLYIRKDTVVTWRGGNIQAVPLS